jgi:secreted trypsin-like serine protease
VTAMHAPRRTIELRPRLRTALAVVLLGLAVAATAPSAEAIHRGSDADFASYPFMVSLRLAQTPDKPRCGGTLIAADIVLTAGHCVVGIPQGGLVAVVGADVPDWAAAPRVATVAYRTPGGFDLRRDNRHDIALVQLAVPQQSEGIALARSEPRVGAKVVTVGWGCTNAPPACVVHPTRLQASEQSVLRDASCGTDVFWVPPMFDRTTICTKGIRPRSTVNHGDSGGPLLVRDGSGSFRQVGVTSLGADSKVKLYAGFTSVPLERNWIARAIASLRR